MMASYQHADTLFLWDQIWSKIAKRLTKSEKEYDDFETGISMF